MLQARGLALVNSSSLQVYALKPTYIPKPGVLGTYAEYVAVKAEWVAFIPDAVPLNQAGGIPLVALTVWQALLSAYPKPSQRILILTASAGVGTFAVQFAKHLGLYVGGTSGARNLDFVRSLGTD